MEKEQYPLKKVCIICAKGILEDVYATLLLANKAVMEGIEIKVFFTFFGLDAITKKRLNKIHTAVVGNPTISLPDGLPFPTLLGIVPGMVSLAVSMMKKEMEKLDLPTVPEFLELITAGGGKIYACKLAMDRFNLSERILLTKLKIF